MPDQAPLIDSADAGDVRRMSAESDSSVSTTSLVFERISERVSNNRSSSKRRTSPTPRRNGYADHDSLSDFDEEDPLKEERDDDLETGPFLASAAVTGGKRMDKSMKRLVIIISGVFVAAWVVALFVYLSAQSYKHASDFEHDPQATASRGHGKSVSMDQLQSGFWYSKSHSISWIRGADGEDGLLMEKDVPGKDYLIVEDVRSQNPDAVAATGAQLASSKTLMRNGPFIYAGRQYVPSSVEPSPNLLKVLIATDLQSNWRHSSTALYWILDVNQQSVEPLDPKNPGDRIQHASWSPTSDTIVFTKENNIYMRRIGYNEITQITKDGGPELFYGVPDWVYEEEVLGGPSATWWSEDGKYIAFLRTNETGVPEYPIQYFIDRPSGEEPSPGEESYPEVRQIKYPKAGAHNPVVDLQFYDIIRGDVFSVEISDQFADDDRLITTVVWAGRKVLIKETNRISDVMRVVLVDVESRTGKTVRTVDVGKLDGGWFEISQNTRYIPADGNKQRPNDGYIDTVIYENNDHLAYFTPLDNPEPIMLTKGDWEVVDAPSAIDLDRNLVYFVSTKESSIQRHVYSVKLDGTNLQAFTDASVEGYYAVSFSSGAGYALVTYAGPNIPWQKVLSTPSNPTPYEHLVEDNKELAERAKQHELPIKIYGKLKVDGVDLNYVERRPPHFDAKKKYPVLFQQYSGPGSQQVMKRFAVDFQSYIASLGYIVVTVDGRGTGFIGRDNRVLIRGNLGKWESHDQIAAAKHWAGLNYVDASKIAIWGWSYGGFMTLKTLEQDAGETFSYGMAVAPVTDWRFYDSIYTERYMKTPQENEAGYDDTAISNVTALGSNVRFLIMHGIADDNVHMQNTLTLLDKLDLAGIENYDVHVFPDSDHGIYFHGANRIVYDSKYPHGFYDEF
ncbi:putative dipeptidyl aminopeptidase b protein [Phaeoacremonium minimum UCRPA7]|uniref:Probable dipeptidyl-aminopeptidase B n=1 Tax=Phaeoacremonium minimum (strain UCR-PA7) TaxID=1286976 RepID=R8BTA0_PHAM7|nr:putative dipeptidyl aminopeptidase b protein [Phaeoacremonium minimum UCRPA7]EOO02628.1 putative dipeptidyl aminopeptidase b protein [Phaeoacremonium minimum UCRPA7]